MPMSWHSSQIVIKGGTSPLPYHIIIKSVTTITQALQMILNRLDRERSEINDYNMITINGPGRKYENDYIIIIIEQRPDGRHDVTTRLLPVE